VRQVGYLQRLNRDARSTEHKIINLYMFRATMCPSAGETTMFARHLVFVILKHVEFTV
jgi:hypothetical protein